MKKGTIGCNVLLALLLVLVNSLRAQNNSIELSEIMFNPTDVNSEFIELYNNSDSVTYNLANLKIIYETSAPDLVNDNTDLLLEPGKYAIILEGDYDLAAGVYKNLIPDDVLICLIDNNSFGRSGMANSSDRTIYLVYETDTLETYLYSADNDKGISDEKFEHGFTDWENSLLIDGSPGMKNSVSPKQHDLKIVSVQKKSAAIIEGENFIIDIMLKNLGFANAENFSLTVYLDENTDSLTEANELIFQDDLQNLESNDSIMVSAAFNGFSKGNYSFIIILGYILDEFANNNVYYYKFNIAANPVEFNSVIINELMIIPKDEPEWIELYNNSSADINLKNWSITDSKSAVELIDKTFLLEPQKYLIITDDSSVVDYYSNKFSFIEVNLPSLNNSGDNVVLKDSLGFIIDSLSYNSRWLNSDCKSLERIESFYSSLDSANWGISNDRKGATPGFINSVTPKDFDLTISGFKTLTPFQIMGESIGVSVTVTNIGRNEVLNSNLELYMDINKDSLVQTTEIILSNNIISLSAQDSAEIIIEVPEFVEGKNNLIALINYQEDLNNFNDTSYTSFTGIKINEIRNDIVINEILYAPDSVSTEWIELYNRSNKEINLKNYKVADANDTSIVNSKDLILKPDKYAIISSDSSFVDFYTNRKNVIIGKFSSLNNSFDTVIILDSLDRVIDSVYYSSDYGYKQGYSIERINSESETDSSNWKLVQYGLRNTLGQINSVSKKDHDLELSNLEFESSYQIIGNSISGNFTVKNIGKTAAQNFTIDIFLDKNSNNILETNELNQSANITLLEANDSLQSSFKLDDFNAGQNHVYAIINFTDDTFPLNDTLSVYFIGVKLNEIRNDLAINEVMYSPGEDRSEWIEIFNRSEKTINLKNYQIADEKDTSRINRKILFVKPNEFYVIARDSSFINEFPNVRNLIVGKFPSLNNDDDKIILLDSLNRVIDSIQYFDKWNDYEHASLERMNAALPSDSLNWLPYKYGIGGSPESINSVTQKDHDLEITDIIYSPEKPFYGDTVFIMVKVKNIGKLQSDFALNLFSDTDLDTLENAVIEEGNEISLTPGDSTIFTFDFFINKINNVNAFFVKIYSAKDQDTLNNSIYKKIEPGFPQTSVIVSEIMYYPDSDEPEWVELYNRSDKIINLKDWEMSDVLNYPQKCVITKKDLFINPSGFLIISKDSVITEFHEFINCSIHILNFANLNNDADGIVIKDNRSITIDSVVYNKSFSLNSGYSLERIDFSKISTDINNWSSSIDFEKSTPGRMNSVTLKQYDPAVVSLEFNPTFPLNGQSVIPILTLCNRGLQSVDGINVLFEILEINNLIKLSEANSISVNVNNTIQVISPNAFELTDSALVRATIIFEKDDDVFNNKISSVIYSGNDKNTVLVNEIMFNPRIDQPEWVEIINNSAKKINLKDWFLTDLSSANTECILSVKDLFIEPDEFLIISSDSLEENPDQVTVISNFPSLGNEDGIKLYDFRGAMIDSIRYNFSSGKKGISIERFINNEETNWSFSLSNNGSTLGRQNSLNDNFEINYNDLIINEIMFEVDTSYSEFVEFYNNSDSEIELGVLNFKKSNETISKFTHGSFKLISNGYFVLYSDSALFKRFPELLANENKKQFSVSSFSLKNDFDILMIKDIYGNVIDSVSYNADWHNKHVAETKNRSLERINSKFDSNDSQNWSTSVNSLGATPLRSNSIYIPDKNSGSEISISPNPFSPDNDGFEDFTIVEINLDEPISQIRAKIFDSKGRLVRNFIPNSSVGSSGKFIFDGLNNDGNPLRIGIYILFVEAVGLDNNIIKTMKEAIVIARKL
ncbi:MAG: lamin tail domain-containing protein [Melioribacteraceae bacterium]|nr:lamin tail domain-containing protein [Melioribacteraceae bacterium]